MSDSAEQPGSSPNDEKGGSQVVPDKPGASPRQEPAHDHEQDREGTSSGSAGEQPDSF